MGRIATTGLVGLLVWAGSVTDARGQVARLDDAGQRRQRLGLAPEYANVQGVENLKVAVLDYGFTGVGAGRGYLPESAVVVEHYASDFITRHDDLGDPSFRTPFEPGNPHGRQMAQIVWAVTGNHPRGPKFYLLNASGPTMLRRAVRYAIEQQVDIILFSNTFEGGGNGDGRGPINRIVSEAVAAGIIWVNAAGNHGELVHERPVQILNDGYLRLGGGRDIAALRFRNKLDENTVTVTLTWNDYQEVEDAGTAKDLDLYVEDWTGRRIGSSELVQIAGDAGAEHGQTRNPRERVVLTDLRASPEVPTDPDCAYRIRVRARSGSFTDNDRIRVLVTAGRASFVRPGSPRPVPAIELLDASLAGEVYPPADHPLVLTVGAGDPTSSVGPTTDRRVKPDVIIDNPEAFFTDGTLTFGSSNAAADFAGIVAVLKAAEPRLSTRHLLQLAQRGGRSSQSQTASRTASSTPAPSTSSSVRMTRPGQTSATAPSTHRQILTDIRRLTVTPSARSTPPPPSPALELTPTTSTRSSLPDHLQRRLWRTPTRAELDAAVRWGL